MKTWHIHIEGRVQGVGFRPFVYGLANEMNLFGTVSNSLDGVHIYLNADTRQIVEFKEELLQSVPALARITKFTCHEATEIIFQEFNIIESTESEIAGSLYLTPDVGICTACRTEIRNAHDRRFGYGYTTCTNCGPRFSIATSLPYDRPNTTMAPFEMCPECFAEYNDPSNRRHYSQTNSCHTCGLKISSGENFIDISLDEIVRAWTEGKIVAIKGIGGYLLTCDATSTETVSMLRKRKNRPSKPFALMFPDINALRRCATATNTEMDALLSPEAPIVLVEIKSEANFLPLQQVAPGLDRIGVMLPYTPLFQILLDAFGKPIIATSANVTNSPIVFDRRTAATQLAEIADLIIHDDRQIHFPQDDSVVAFTPKKDHPIILRRSRGLAPAYIANDSIRISQNGLATGAMMKSALAITHNGQVRISQYLGDLDHFDTEQRFRDVLAKMLALHPVDFQCVLTDMHPGYATARIAEEMADKWKVPLVKIQHHEAHFGAILGEHWHRVSGQKVLGVIWDGTGLGDDGNIWGGEFFVYDRQQIERKGHLEYSKALFGDKPSREPRLAALLRCTSINESKSILRPMFSSTEWPVYSTATKRPAQIMSSSMGRLFDSVAAVLGICTIQSFEGEAAMLLEVSARRWRNANPDADTATYLISINEGIISIQDILRGVIADIHEDCPTGMIAYKFHKTLVQMIRQFAIATDVNHIACSGGVFQNSLLVDMVIGELGSEYEILLHDQLSPNDENIAYGQLVIQTIRNQYQHSTTQQSANHVLSNSW